MKIATSKRHWKVVNLSELDTLESILRCFSFWSTFGTGFVSHSSLFSKSRTTMLCSKLPCLI